MKNLLNQIMKFGIVGLFCFISFKSHFRIGFLNRVCHCVFQTVFMDNIGFSLRFFFFQMV